MAVLTFIVFLSPTIIYSFNALISSESSLTIRYPGEQYDVLDSKNVKITSSELEVYEDGEGKLLMTTVSVLDNPLAWDVLLAMFDDNVSVVNDDEEQVTFYDVPTVIADYYEDEVEVSLNFALASAFDFLNLPYKSKLNIANVAIDMGDGTTIESDRATLLEVDGVKISNFKTVESYLLSLKDDSPLSIKLELEDGEVYDVTVKPEYSETLQRYSLGLYALPKFDFPVAYSFTIPEVGGGSAGLILAINAVESLTKEKLLPNAVIGGTGAINSSGEVEEIAGLTQKLVAANRNNNEYFFIPKSMCVQVAKKYSGMTIIPVATLSEAMSEIAKIKSNQPVLECLPKK
jgi:PDZ domain-containing protein